VLAFHRQIKIEGSISLGLVLAVDRTVADRPAAYELTRHVALWLTLLLAGVAISAILARQLSRPIQALAVAARRVEAGDLSARTENAQADRSELGQLGRVFNDMVARLQQWHQDLEQQVAERTQELRTLSARQDAILKAVPDIIMEVDHRNIYTWSNNAGFAFFGVDVIGREAAAYFDGDQQTYEVLQPLHEGTANLIYVESWQRRQDGAVRLLAWRCRAIVDEHSRVTGLLSTARDITDIKQAEARVNEERERLQTQLTQSQKMEAVGRLAGGVAHDFNNMLGVILGHADMILSKMAPNEPFHADLTEIIKAGERSADLTRQLLAFARRQTVAPKVLDLNETVADMTKMLQRLIGEEIEIVWIPGEKVWPIKIDPSQIDQLLANLCVNARDAIAGVGKVTIETGNAIFDEDYRKDHAGVVPGEYVLLAVRDTGCGMNSETLSQIFEPFFTTKELGKGTGLGLATVYGIIQQNRGFIHVESEPGQGTIFKLYFPRHVNLDEQGRGLTLTPSPEGMGHETILVVEDEPMILEITTAMLKHLGYTVYAAKTPGEAIELARDHAGELHLLLTDVVMPQMNGKELASQLMVLYPGLRSLFMSGYPAEVIAQHGVIDEGVDLLQKPFMFSTLAAKVREILNQG
jgi:PAS domain S-box-containing protein